MARDRASRPEAKPLRLFAAVEIPEEIRGALAEAVTPSASGSRRPDGCRSRTST